MDQDGEGTGSADKGTGSSLKFLSSPHWDVAQRQGTGKVFQAEATLEIQQVRKW